MMWLSYDMMTDTSKVIDWGIIQLHRYIMYNMYIVNELMSQTSLEDTTGMCSFLKEDFIQL